MSVAELRALERLHAVIAWLATAGLLWAAWASVRRRLPAGGAAAAAALVVLAGLLGAALEEGFRARVRHKLFLAAPALGWLFERKVHVAFGAVLLGVAAWALTAALRRIEPRADEADVARELRRGAAIAWTAAAVLALLASVASAIVARRAGF